MRTLAGNLAIALLATLPACSQGNPVASCREAMRSGRDVAILAGDALDLVGDFAEEKIAGPEFERSIADIEQGREDTLSELEEAQERCTSDGVTEACVEGSLLASDLATVSGDLITLAGQVAAGDLSITELARQANVLVSQGDQADADLDEAEDDCRAA